MTWVLLRFLKGIYDYLGCVSDLVYAPEGGRAGELDPGGLLEEGEGAFWGRCGDGGTARLLEEVVVVVGGCVEVELCKT